MPWFEGTFPSIKREVHRLMAKVRPILPREWLGRAGAKVRQTVTAISDFAEEHNVTPNDLASDAIELGRHKLEGWVEQERAGAIQKFAEKEKLDLEAERLRRTMDPAVRKERAEARIKEIEVLRAELAFLEDLKKAGAVIRVEKDGAWTVLPAPPNLNLLDAVDLLPTIQPAPTPGQILFGPRRPLPPRLGGVQSSLSAGNQLHEIREILGLSKAALAEVAGVTQATIRRAEADPESVTQVTKRRIVAAINKAMKRDKANIHGKDQFTLPDVFPQ